MFTSTRWPISYPAARLVARALFLSLPQVSTNTTRTPCNFSYYSPTYVLRPWNRLADTRYSSGHSPLRAALTANHRPPTLTLPVTSSSTASD